LAAEPRADAPLDLDAALAALLDAVTPLPGAGRVPVDDAVGRVTEGAVAAPMAVPPFPNSAMDGYAVRHDDPALAADEPLPVIDRSLAGAPAGRAVEAGTCIRVFTGAVMPAGADAVIAQEDAREAGDGHVRFLERPAAGRFVRAAGGDVAAGARLVDDGVRLHAGHLGLLAATGVETVAVRALPRIAVLTTGDELMPPGTELAPGQIFDASAVALPALLSPLPVRVVHRARVGDDADALERALDAAAAVADAVVCAGGVSVGDADHVRPVVERHGEIGFWRLALKPGRPFAFGRYREALLFGLPGNPVSSLVTALLLVRPGLQRLAGMTPPPLPVLDARLAAPVRKAPGRRDFQRGTLARTADGWRVTPFERQDSNVLSGLADGDALIDLPREAGDLETGTAVGVVPLAGLLGPY
jgi:molybdopterin molybdotransferase